MNMWGVHIVAIVRHDFVLCLCKMTQHVESCRLTICSVMHVCGFNTILILANKYRFKVCYIAGLRFDLLFAHIFTFYRLSKLDFDDKL